MKHKYHRRQVLRISSKLHQGYGSFCTVLEAGRFRGAYTGTVYDYKVHVHGGHCDPVLVHEEALSPLSFPKGSWAAIECICGWNPTKGAKQ